MLIDDYCLKYALYYAKNNHVATKKFYSLDTLIAFAKTVRQEERFPISIKYQSSIWVPGNVVFQSKTKFDLEFISSECDVSMTKLRMFETSEKIVFHQLAKFYPCEVKTNFIPGHDKITFSIRI